MPTEKIHGIDELNRLTKNETATGDPETDISVWYKSVSVYGHKLRARMRVAKISSVLCSVFFGIGFIFSVLLCLLLLAGESEFIELFNKIPSISKAFIGFVSPFASWVGFGIFVILSCFIIPFFVSILLLIISSRVSKNKPLPELQGNTYDKMRQLSQQATELNKSTHIFAEGTTVASLITALVLGIGFVILVILDDEADISGIIVGSLVFSAGFWLIAKILMWLSVTVCLRPYNAVFPKIKKLVVAIETVQKALNDIEKEEKAEQEAKDAAQKEKDAKEAQRLKEKKEREELPAARARAEQIKKETLKKFGNDFQRIAKYMDTSNPEEVFCLAELSWKRYKEIYVEQTGNLDYDAQYSVLAPLIKLLDLAKDADYIPAKYYDEEKAIYKEYYEVKRRISQEKRDEVSGGAKHSEADELYDRAQRMLQNSDAKALDVMRQAASLGHPDAIQLLENVERRMRCIYFSDGICTKKTSSFSIYKCDNPKDVTCYAYKQSGQG